MSESKPGAVIFGTNVGLTIHAFALKGAGVEVRALVGRDPQKTAERAKFAGIPLALTSMDEALALPGVDLVCVTTPPHTHLEIVKAALAAGKHVVCEKPFARDLAQAEEMLELARNTGLVHALGHEHRFDPWHSRAALAVRDGLIGEPRMMTHILTLPMFAGKDTVVPDWWGDAEQGGGWLGAHAVHMFDTTRFLLGSDLSGLSASLDTISQHGWTAEDTFSIHFRTVSGASGIIQSSISDMGPPLLQTRIAGTEGAIRVENGKVMLIDADGEREIEQGEELRLHNMQPQTGEFIETTYDQLCAGANNIGPYTRLYESVIETIQGKELTHPTPFPTFEDAVIGQRTMDATRLSHARGGEWQSLV